MRDARLQYFLTLGMLGTVLPYASVFFRHAGLSNLQVGNAFAIYGLAAVVSPALVTTLADHFGQPRRWLAGLNILSAVFLGLLAFAGGVKTVFGVWTCFCVTFVPIFPLLNGIHFGQQENNRRAGKPEAPFHGVRAWGTVGYISVSLFLFPLLHYGMSLRWVVFSGAILGALAAVQTFLLAEPPGRSGDDHTTANPINFHLPALQAAKSLLSRPFVAFTSAVILMSMASQIHAAFYPIYLTERVKLADQWLGEASNVAVLIEVFLIFGCGWLVRRVGVKQLLIWCILATALRMALLASTNNVWVAIGTQVSHGLLIIAIGVLPQTLFNDHADERFRHSMQGMLVMLTSGGQCIASFLAGFVAAYSISAAYGCAALLCVIAAGLVVYGFHEAPGAESELDGRGAAELTDKVVALAAVGQGPVV